MRKVDYSVSYSGSRQRPLPEGNTQHTAQPPNSKKNNKRKRCFINGTLTIALRVRAARSPAKSVKCHFSQSFPDLLVSLSLHVLRYDGLRQELRQHCTMKRH